MKKIVILDGKALGDVELEKLKEIGEVFYYDTTLENEVSDRIKDANIVLTNKVVLNRENLIEAKNLEFIAEVATGFNNIDIDYAKERGIAVANVAGYSTTAVVQHTLATALALFDEVLFYDNFVKSGQYSASGLFTCLDKPYYEIEGKIWGIIGLGNIGRRVAKIAEAFGAKVIYYSTSGKNSSEEFERVSLDELLKQSDVISIHAPLNNNTLGLINYEALCKMKKSAILINMGRGPIVVEKDLAKAIDEEEIRGAALDVFEIEPIKEDNELLNIKNKDRLILSPHIAWASVESRDRLFKEVVENIKAFYRGEVRNRVDK
ncbi:D-2-hydroxyacid dehydrogenase [Clostridium celatum]|uniref:Putative glycerate dehydrogenase n=1 Tax=Clostridium celatum DSM 1785 TaxID=545697 RepID=L1QEE4_9CLOT|nr:D-2-hydroxyacid dehydrogenase [Clostridium celatum]EKY26296.1 putative glycerate dehydrogenase [Clostridium celatum DSM 1785]MCE9653977.1 D-2-hydroxyacid dehydrogenase [Clostridium celatum]MDY3359798.1 D-2-hydroxyacid dehydrogenase [Clostridium celatum]